MKKATIRDLAFMAICVALSLVTKRVVSPLTNGLTDFFRIPGGSTAIGFSLAFLIVGKRLVSVPFAGTLMSTAQALLALDFGFSGETVNGKGERAADDYRGIEMSALLREYDIDPARVTGMVVTASDQYSAEYTGDEIREPGKVFLATRRNGKEIEGIEPGRSGIWVIVFGDSDSRRLVRNPDRIHINSPEGSAFREEN